MPITIFLADDHAVVREGLRALLGAQHDLRVVGEAGDGRDAVKQVCRLRPDVVVMDIAMPELNGIEAVVKICECCPETRVVMLSVYATSEHVYRALKAGALGYVVKESAGQEVAEAVRAVHAGRRYLSPRVTEKVEADFVHQRGELPAKSPLESLSEREREVLQLVVEGWSSAEIAAKIFLSPKSVETYRSRIMLKLGVHDLPGLIRFAIQHGMTTAE